MFYTFLMPYDFNRDQKERLRNLGIEIGKDNLPSSSIVCLKRSNKSLWAMIGASVLTAAGFGGLLIVKQQSNKLSVVASDPDVKKAEEIITRTTPVTANIQKYLLASQQYFSQAILAQNSNRQDEVVNLLNKAIEEANQAVSNFPKDYRGYQQRGSIFQSLISNENNNSQDSKFINQAISDYSLAYKHNPDLVETSRNLAGLYAKLGDAQMTIYFLTEAIRIEPTKAQNFYDLARIQNQKGDLVAALETYKQLIWLVSDTNQKQILEKEKKSIEEILAQNPELKKKSSEASQPNPTGYLFDSDSIKVEASRENNVIIAQSGEATELEVTGMTDSNSMSGEAKLLANTNETRIKNSNIKSNSQIYVSIISGGKNQVLRVKAKTDVDFAVGLDSPINEEIKFKWWIIN